MTRMSSTQSGRANLRGARREGAGSDGRHDQPVGRQAADGGPAVSDFRLLIDGRLVEGAGVLDVINPATGRILTTAPRADRAQLEEAVAAAKAAFPTWSARPLGERRGLLIKLAEALEEEQGEFARLLTE